MKEVFVIFSQAIDLKDNVLITGNTIHSKDGKFFFDTKEECISLIKQFIDFDKRYNHLIQRFYRIEKHYTK